MRFQLRPAAALRVVLPVVLFLPTVASAQKSAASEMRLNWRADPVFGTLRLSGGFSDDPRTEVVRAGGADANPVTGEGCVGFLNAAAPDLNVAYTASTYDLTFSAASETDASLVVRTPDGRWLCDDDGADVGLNPTLTVAGAPSGTYHLWVATYQATDERPRTVVGVSEIGREAVYAAEGGGAKAGGDTGGALAQAPDRDTDGLPDWRAAPLYGDITLRAGFSPDPHERAIRIGGSTPNPVSGAGCAGYINRSAPDYVLYWTAGSGTLPLNLYVKSDADASLVVYTGDGRWLCDDDSGEGTNPWISLQTPASGSYQIWVGAYQQGTTGQQGRLVISEIAPRW